jgi:hypothetical protein
VEEPDSDGAVESNARVLTRALPPRLVTRSRVYRGRCDRDMSTGRGGAESTAVTIVPRVTAGRAQGDESIGNVGADALEADILVVRPELFAEA